MQSGRRREKSRKMRVAMQVAAGSAGPGRQRMPGGGDVAAGCAMEELLAADVALQGAATEAPGGREGAPGGGCGCWRPMHSRSRLPLPGNPKRLKSRACAIWDRSEIEAKFKNTRF